jgi:divalent metal cation (Fe/Co/Zn/Cd) transporter
MLDDQMSDGAISGHHHVRHRCVNDQVWIEQHVMLPDASTLVEAHEHVSALEARQRGLFPESRVQITTHIEPASHHHGADVLHDAVADARAAGPLRDQLPDAGDAADRVRA